MKWSVIIDKPTKDGLWAVRKVYTGNFLSSIRKFIKYRLKYGKKCSVYQDIYGEQFPGEPINEYRYKSMGSIEWTYED